MDQYREQAANKQTLFSEDPVMVKKVDLGEPVQLKLRAGDGFMCTQRLATLMAHNTTSDVASFAFFRVSHVDHAVMKEPALQSMWVEYQHASQFLESSPDLLNSGWEEVAPAVAVPTDEETQFIQKDSSAPEEL